MVIDTSESSDGEYREDELESDIGGCQLDNGGSDRSR